jgi:hypothetical protein
MSAYKDAIAIDSNSPEQRVSVAADLLTAGKVVLLEDMLALRLTDDELLCEVLDPMPSSHRCATEYEVLVENARRALQSSVLWKLLPRTPSSWIVVEDYGTGTVERWRAP